MFIKDLLIDAYDPKKPINKDFIVHILKMLIYSEPGQSKRNNLLPNLKAHQVLLKRLQNLQKLLQKISSFEKKEVIVCKKWSTEYILQAIESKWWNCAQVSDYDTTGRMLLLRLQHTLL